MCKTDCIDVELCDKCFTLPCKCIIVNIKDGIIRGEHLYLLEFCYTVSK